MRFSMTDVHPDACYDPLHSCLPDPFPSQCVSVKGAKGTITAYLLHQDSQRMRRGPGALPTAQFVPAGTGIC